jgi:hypothetical protein
MNFGSVSDWRCQRRRPAGEIAGKSWNEFGLSIFLFGQPRQKAGAASPQFVLPNGLILLSTAPAPRSKATSRSELIHTRSDSEKDESFADISPNALPVHRTFWKVADEQFGGVNPNRMLWDIAR